MDRQNYAQLPTDIQQWPQQQHQQQQGYPAHLQQPNPEIQQPQPQYPQMPNETPAMPLPMPNQSTPQLNAMYSQESLPARQGFAQEPHVHFQDDPMPQQMQGRAMPPQQHHDPTAAAMPGLNYGRPYGTSIDPGEYAASQPQQQAFMPQAPTPVPQAPSYTSHVPHQPRPFSTDPAATAWEQQNVQEINTSTPTPAPAPSFQQHRQEQPTAATATATAASRAAELAHARQRIQALEAAREQHDTQQALQLSMQQNATEMQGQEARQVHEVLLQSLDSYEEDLRRHLGGARERSLYGDDEDDDYDGAVGGGGGKSYGAAGYGEASSPSRMMNSAAAAAAAAAAGYADPRHGTTFSSPAPSTRSVFTAQRQAQHHAPPFNPARSQTTSIAGSTIDLSRINSPGLTSPSHPNPNANWTTPAPRPYTPTPGAAPANAAMNQAAEEARRWRAFEQAQMAQQGSSLGAGTEAGWELGSEGVSTIGKGKGRRV